MYRTLLLTLLLGLAAPSTLHAQDGDQVETSTSQSVDLPRSRGGEVDEAGSDPDQQAPPEESQADGGSETQPDGSGDGMASDGAQAEYSSGQNATTSGSGTSADPN